MARILVIDDDKLFSALIRRALTQHNHEIVLVEDPKTARATFAAEDFDAVVCDIVLPNESGLQIIRDLREAKPSVAIVAVSGGKVDGRSVHIDVLHLAEKLGADAVVKKPFDLATFAATVETTLARKQQGGRAVAARA